MIDVIGEFFRNKTLVFTDKTLELAFQAHHAKHIIPQIRLAIIVASLLYALFSILDFLVIKESPIAASVIRYCFVIPIFFAAYCATYKYYFRKRLQLLVSLIICVAGFGIALIAVLYETTRSDIFFMGILLPIFWAFLYSGLRFNNAVKVGVFLIVLYEGVFLLFSQMSFHTLIGLTFFILTSFFIGVLGGYRIEHYSRRDFLNQRSIREEKQKNEKLLLNILPKSIAKELLINQSTIARDYEEVTVLFSDLVGFTKLSSNLSALEVVNMLNDIFSRFDQLTDKYNLEKIKTIGDAYMVTSNPSYKGEKAIETMALFALDMQHALADYNMQHQVNIPLRIGMHTGPAVAGVIGVKKFVYDIWGSTVNIASRMETHCPVNKIQVSQQSYDLLKARFNFEARGEIEIKDIGHMSVYLLLAPD